ncbi:MAG: FAD-binding oxidoreductase, partial [Gammaproteobacteria bacterium]|nr:FAD-binding oxidoreductase [Gammaproteobacteria bacterium]
MRRSSEHIASYYAATRSSDKSYPALEGEHRCDVAVVGGGFTGVSTALHLAERGYDVALIEANRIGWGASGRNGGQLIDGFVNADKIEKRLGTAAADMARRMRFESRDIVVQRIERYAIDCDLKFGFLDVAQRAGHMRDFEEYLERKLRANYAHDIRIVPQQAMREYIDSDHYIGGLADYGNGHLHPLNLCAGEARAANELGATIFEQSAVMRIQHGQYPAVETESGRVVAGKLVLAGNAYLRDVEPRIRHKIIPAGSYIIATEPLEAARAAKLLPADMAYCEQTVGLNYFRMSPDKRLLFGGMCNYSGRHPRDITAALRPKMLKIFPQLEDLSIDYEWGGNIAISINRIPQFGRIEGNT